MPIGIILTNFSRPSLGSTAKTWTWSNKIHATCPKGKNKHEKPHAYTHKGGCQIVQWRPFKHDAKPLPTLRWRGSKKYESANPYNHYIGGIMSKSTPTLGWRGFSNPYHHYIGEGKKRPEKAEIQNARKSRVEQWTKTMPQ